jgi:hypothetical protein
LKASSISLAGPTSFLFKAPWGFGKTIAAASFALGGPTYLAYWDKKAPRELITFYRKLGEKGKKVLDNLEFDVYGSSNANDYLNKVIDMRGNCRYTTFITDSVTTLTAGAVNWSLGFNDKGKRVEKKTDNPQQIIPQFDEYKTETSFVSQALDICRTLPCHVIWTAHPLPGIKIEGSGNSMKVSKVNPIVTYGSKVAGIVPGEFSEIYQFTKTADFSSGSQKIRYKVSTEAIGDDYAKSSLGLPIELDITDRLFYEVWIEALEQVNQAFTDSMNKEKNEVVTTPAQPNVFNPQTLPITNQPTKIWDSELGAYK